MAHRLVYQLDDGEVSPFDRAAISIAKDAELSVACPYISLRYFEHLISVARGWRLVTDIEELFATLGSDARKSFASFISKNHERVRDSPGLHAKVIIGSTATMIGSANLTISGITQRTEMATYIDSRATVREVLRWYETLWAASSEVASLDLTKEIKRIPLPVKHKARSPLAKDGTYRNTRLVTLEEGHKPLQYLQYRGAIGYFSSNGGGFCVLKGSPARRYVRDSFTYIALRNQLIRNQILVRSDERADYRFAIEYQFDSPSAAACIVSGQSRSGPQMWKKVKDAPRPV